MSSYTAPKKGRKRGSKLSKPELSDAEVRSWHLITVMRWRAGYWPLSDRQIHYRLLNLSPLRHSKKPGSRYVNNLACYKDLTNLLTRLRLVGRIPWEAIGDETRPVTEWPLHRSCQTFIADQVQGFLGGYWRDPLQSQPNHIEIIVEKNTVAGIIKPIAANYGMRMTSGRGFCSINPRREMRERFRKSGKSKKPTTTTGWRMASTASWPTSGCRRRASPPRSASRIAETAGVSNNFVSDLRREVEPRLSSDDSQRTRTGRDGIERKVPSKAPPRPVAAPSRPVPREALGARRSGNWPGRGLCGSFVGLSVASDPARHLITVMRCQLLVSDFDPEGWMISQSFAQSMRDDFGITDDELVARKVALTPEQVKRFKLPRGAKAKGGSKFRPAFVKRFGQFVWELEALEPATLQGLVKEAIEGSLDIKAFNWEAETERQEAEFLAAQRELVMSSLKLAKAPKKRGR
jgi:hypothetical protein